MEIFIAVALASGIAAAAGYVWRRRKKSKAGEAGGDQETAAADVPPQLPERAEAGLDNLRPDDVVMVEGRDFIVAGVARVAEPAAPYSRECRLDDAGDEAWLVVCGGDKWVLYGSRVELTVSNPPSELLDYQGKVFRLEHRGQVTFAKVAGDMGELPTDQCGYWEYTQPGSDRLWLRKGGDRFWAFVGQRLRAHEVTVLPGS